MATLVLLQGNPPKKKYSLVHVPCIRIGRNVEEDEIQVEDGNVSRHHALIMYDKGQYVLVDLHSSNGTFVNGHPVDTHVLNDGDIVTVGHSMLRFNATVSTAGEDATPGTYIHPEPETRREKKRDKNNSDHPLIPAGV